MSPLRRLLLAALAWPASAAASAAADANDDAISAQRRLRFPRDHGAHPGARIEWWYATGWLDTGDAAAPMGFQLTFFRSRTGLGAGSSGRFAPRQLLFAHAALSDIAAKRHRHAQRVARWSGDERDPAAHAARADADVLLGPWSFKRDPASGRYAARLAAPQAGFTLALELTPTQPLLLQGEAGFSRKGPLPAQASHYTTQPQLAVRARLTVDGRERALPGIAWLDHEWSDELMPAEAIGWDWIGINLNDGGALTAFVLRGRDGQVIWAGGSHRGAGGEPRNFAPAEVRFSALRFWTSPATGARYPVHWRIETPVGIFGLEALLDAQELDSRASTGAVYWEGLSALRDERGATVGRGYLEMTGRLVALRLG